MKPSPSSGGWLTGYLFSEDDPALRQIVRCHFHVDAIADDRSDAEAPHLAGRVGNNPDLILEHHPESAIGQDFVDDAFDGQQLFFRQVLNPGRTNCRPVVVGELSAAIERGLAINIIDYEP